MAAQKPTLPKGTRDFGPADVQKRKYILNTIETVFKKYGFMPLETPTMENLSTLEGKYGEEGDKLLFRILDSGDYWSELSKDLLFLYESIILITEDIFVRKRLNEEDAKNPISLKIFLDNNFKSILLTQNIFGLLYGTHSNNLQIINKFESKISLLAYELSKFYVQASVNAEMSEASLSFHIKQFIINQFGELFNYKFVTGEVTEKGLRYDLTVPFARYVVMNRSEITFPFKRYQMQPVWRADRPQKGRYREFWQCDADVVGSDSLLNEVDLMCVYHEAFTQLGIGYELKVNNRKVLAGIAEVVKSIEHMTAIAVAIDKLDKIGEDGVKKELSEQGFTDAELKILFDIISVKGENGIILEQLKGKLQQSQQGLQGIDELSYLLNNIGILNESNSINISLDFSLARGLSYYTGCIFEVVATEGTLKSSIGGGGRYDNLTGIFGLPNVSGVGISFGLDRIYDVLEELKLFPQQLRATNTTVLFCHFDEASQAYCLPAAAALRKAGIATEIYPDVVKKKPMGKQLDYANALQIPYAAIAGENEMQQKVFNLKNLTTGEQQAVTIEELIRLVTTN
jgi:histidyl-tRNA synthetase